MKLNQLISSISQLDSGLKHEANKAVNTLLTLRNWVIGYYLVEYEQNGEDRAEYGERVLETVAVELNEKGLSFRNLKLFRQFFLTFPEIWQTASAKSHLPQNSNPEIGQTLSALLDSEQIGQTASALLTQTAHSEEIDLTQKMLTQLSFSHITLLLPLKDRLQRQFYTIESIKGTWSVRELKRQINALLYERSGMSISPAQLIKSLKAETVPSKPRGLIKDIYSFEFLGLPQKLAVEESDLETALVEHLRDFILELGNGFCLEARQKRILIGDEYFFIDLVFYHRILKCHVLVELKVEEFSHANAGQLNTYLNYYKQEIKQPTDNDPIGILLVTNRNEALVEYATAGMDQNLFVSKYMLQLPSKDQLEEFVRNEIKELKE
ncbi:MAG: DUF1016 family protein [Flavobacteriales bacterium]|nr:DUF1016 family protein [Flavobacteriales bacterium]